MKAGKAIKVEATGDLWKINSTHRDHIELTSNGRRIGMSTIHEAENFIKTGMGTLIDDESSEWTVEIGTWINGAPITIESWNTESYDTGYKALWSIGHGQEYGVNYAGYIKWKGEIRAILTMQADSKWGIKKID